LTQRKKKEEKFDIIECSFMAIVIKLYKRGLNDPKV
jgi:hypothetical protein